MRDAATRRSSTHPTPRASLGGENIADLGGLSLAFAALEASDARDADRLNGFTPQQRFFLAYATLWRENTTKERALKMLALDPHGPNEWRAPSNVWASGVSVVRMTA